MPAFSSLPVCAASISDPVSSMFLVVIEMAVVSFGHFFESIKKRKIFARFLHKHTKVETAWIEKTGSGMGKA